MRELLEGKSYSLYIRSSILYRFIIKYDLLSVYSFKSLCEKRLYNFRPCFILIL